MKYVVLLAIVVFSFNEMYSQFNIPGIIKKKIEEKVEKKTEEGVEKLFEENNNEEEDNPDSNKNVDEGSKKNSNDTPKSITPTLKSYSKFDFIPGENIIFFEDFSSDPIGDFPARWNTNGSGEVVTLEKYPGKWLKLTNDAMYSPEITYPFPTNYTLEYDVIFFVDDLGDNNESDPSFGWFKVEMASMLHPEKAITDEMYSRDNPFKNSFEFEYSFGNSSRFVLNNEIDGNFAGINSDLNLKFLKGYYAKPIHISIAVNNQRFRVWVNENKAFDLPKFFHKDKLANIIRFTTYALWDNFKSEVLLSNIRFAKSKQDNRSKLITEGKIVTNAIKFDTGSDKIKPESYSTIKSIADVLKSNPDVKIKIIGHTDSDGNADKNLTLSKLRAESVKKTLIDEFQIDSARIETDGKGATMPIGDNTKAEGKAQNRRVEFIKL